MMEADFELFLNRHPEEFVTLDRNNALAVKRVQMMFSLSEAVLNQTQEKFETFAALAKELVRAEFSGTQEEIDSEMERHQEMERNLAMAVQVGFDLGVLSVMIPQKIPAGQISEGQKVLFLLQYSFMFSQGRLAPEGAAQQFTQYYEALSLIFGVAIALLSGTISVDTAISQLMDLFFKANASSTQADQQMLVLLKPGFINCISTGFNYGRIHSLMAMDYSMGA